MKITRQITGDAQTDWALLKLASILAEIADNISDNEKGIAESDVGDKSE